MLTLFKARSVITMNPSQPRAEAVLVRDGRIIEVTSPNQARPKDGNPPIDWDEEVYLSWDASSSVVLTE